MALNDYRLIREGSTGFFAEKTLVPENGKVLSFDASLNPIMVTPLKAQKIINASLPSTSWIYDSGLGMYQVTHSDALIREDMIIILVPALSAYMDWYDAQFHPQVVPANGECTIRCLNLPANNIRVDLYLIDLFT